MASVPKIKDVARAAGVSTATVSRVLNKPETVAETTRLAVLAAAERTGYRINLAARNLRRKRTGGVVVLVPNLGNPFFSRILAGIETTLSSADLNVLIADTKQPHSRPELLFQYMHNNRADGIITLDGSLPRELLADSRTLANSPPIVFACEWTTLDSFPSVRAENAKGAALAIRHLHGLGHRAIGHVCGPGTNVLTIERRRGTLEEMAALGLAVREDWIFDGDFTLESGARAATRWLALDERPSAVFCSSDQMAFGFISELHRHRVMVPRDVSVVGFDDIDIAPRFIPSLTTIRQPREELGRRAAQMLVERIGQRRAEDGCRKQVLDVELIVRESTGPAAGGQDGIRAARARPAPA